MRKRPCRSVGRQNLGVDHAGLAVEQAPDPFFAVDMHARGQAVAPIGRMLQRHGVDRPLQDEKADRQNIDCICRHIICPQDGNAATQATSRQRAVRHKEGTSKGNA